MTLDGDVEEQLTIGWVSQLIGGDATEMREILMATKNRKKYWRLGWSKKKHSSTPT